MRARLTTEGVASVVKVATKAAERNLEGAPQYDKTKITHVVSVLTQVTAAMENTKHALEELTSVPSDEISPDGNLGGRGNVMSIRDMKTEMSETLVSLSSLRDTLSDELNNPGWGLSKDEKESITRVQEKSEEGSQEAIEDITQELEQIFGADDESEEEGPSGEEEKLPEDDEAFPTFDESGEPEESVENNEVSNPKEASSSNTPFVGLDKSADGVTRKLASAVLTGLVKSCTKSTKQVGERQ